MKEICRLIGTIVLIVALVFFVLCKLNGMGFLTGALKSWTTSVSYHITAIKDDTVVFLHEEGILKSDPAATGAPTPASTAVPTYSVPAA